MVNLFMLSYVNRELMSQMSDLVTKMNGTAAAVSLGESVKGVIVKQKDPTEMNEISLAYDSPIRNFDVGINF